MSENKPIQKVYNLRSRTIIHDLQHVPRKAKIDLAEDTLGDQFSKVTRRLPNRKKHNSHPTEGSRGSSQPAPQLSARKKRAINEVLDKESRSHINSPQVSKTPKLDRKEAIKHDSECLTPNRKAVVSQFKKASISEEEGEKIIQKPKIIEKSDDERLAELEPIIKTFEAAKIQITCTNQKWTSILEINDENRTEAIKNDINANIGKFSLILTSKFKQFSKLIEKVKKNETHGDQHMSANDLWGLWTNIERQITQIDTNFKELEKLKGNGWKEIQTKAPIKKVVKNGPKKVKAKSEEQIKRELESKKRMAEFRKKMMKDKNNTASGSKSGVMFL